MAPESPEARPPSIVGVLETVLYYTDHGRAQHFYRDVLGMVLMESDSARHMFFRAGRSVFLLFDAAASSIAGKLPAHGARGSVHTCFQVPPDAYLAWKDYLAGHGIPILREMQWTRGRSFYFHDPDANLLEIADADIWPTAIEGGEKKS